MTERDTDNMTHADAAGYTGPVVDRVFTVANVVSFIRLLMVPVFLYLLVAGYNVAACLVFAVAAGTDWVDGQIARRTRTVSKLGRLLDPVVDRALMIAGVVGLLMVGRLPVWVVVLVLARDLLMLLGGSWALRAHGVRVDVVYAGKVVTTLLFVGCALLLANYPMVPGLGICDLSWLPGFTGDAVCCGIWFVYAGLVLGVFTTAHYIRCTLRGVRADARRGA